MLASRSAADAFASFEWAPTAADLADLRRALYARIELNAERDENLRAWREILLTNPSPRTEFLPRFTNDRPAAYDPSSKDHLGTDPDIVALARMICLKEGTTPLSVGILVVGAPANPHSWTVSKRR